jgi:hypothetical protein
VPPAQADRFRNDPKNQAELHRFAVSDTHLIAVNHGRPALADVRVRPQTPALTGRYAVVSSCL